MDIAARPERGQGRRQRQLPSTAADIEKPGSRENASRRANQTALPTRDMRVVNHPHTHHGAACRAMLQLLECAFPRPQDSSESD